MASESQKNMKCREDSPMRIALISFSRKGASTCQSLALGLEKQGTCCKAFALGSFAEETGLFPVDTSLAQWAKEVFYAVDALVFVGACGIAVRAIAPLVKSKTSDPAVVVVDEKGNYAISLLSGHMGGANNLAKRIAVIVGAEPVITTATDVQGLLAVDEWAQSQNLRIESMVSAKEISAALLGGKEIGLISHYPIEGSVPNQLVLYDEGEQSQSSRPIQNHEFGIVVSSYKETDEEGLTATSDAYFKKTLKLIPRVLTLGIGCRKDTPMETIDALVKQSFAENKLLRGAIKQICSIDLKLEEEGLCRLAQVLKVPFRVYSAEELKAVEGEFTPSDFVRGVTGVENVCERAAVLGSKGKLIVRKQAMNGVTLAVALREESYTWI